MTLISTTTVGASSVATVVFSSIPQTGTDLLLVGSARSSNANGLIFIQLNAIGGTGTGKNLRGTGSSVLTASGGEQYLRSNSGDTASTFSNFSIYIPNYTTTADKTLSIDGVTENNASLAFASIAGVSISTGAAVTTLTIKDNNSGSLVQYSTFSLYTITKGSGGASVS
jgi:hypothetical protein